MKTPPPANRALPLDTPVLGIECTSWCGGATLIVRDGILASRLLRAKSNHSARMLPAIQQLLEQAQLQPADLAAVAVSLGPGSFTGVRVGLSLAKGLARAAARPLNGVPTLQALALRGLQPGRDICPLIDARRHEVYHALFSVDRASRQLKRKLPDGVAPLAAVLENMKRPTLFLGDGAVHYRRQIRRALGDNAHFAPPARLQLSPDEIAAIGLERLDAGQTDDPATLTPIYLRQPDAKKPATSKQ